MALLKEDGSLDVERINHLPLEEYKKEIFSLTSKQYEELIDNSCKGLIMEKQQLVQAMQSTQSLQEELESGNVFRIEDVINNMKKYVTKK